MKKRDAKMKSAEMLIMMMF